MSPTKSWQSVNPIFAPTILFPVILSNLSLCFFPRRALFSPPSALSRSLTASFIVCFLFVTARSGPPQWIALLPLICFYVLSDWTPWGSYKLSISPPIRFCLSVLPDCNRGPHGVPFPFAPFSLWTGFLLFGFLFLQTLRILFAIFRFI